MPSSNSNYEWAVGFFKQACYDLFHGQRIQGNSQFKKGWALSLAQFQQAAEKAMKAAAIWETKKRIGQDEMILLTHQIWQDVLRKEAHLRPLKNSLLDSIAPWPEEMICELEDFAPHGTTDRENSEYPWQTGDDVVIPAEHFSEERLQSKVSQLRGIADGLVLYVKDSRREFSRVFEAVKLDFTEADLTGELNGGETEQ